MELESKALTDKIIAAAIEVHRHLGPGLLESAYEVCLADELERSGFTLQRQMPLPISYKGRQLDAAYRLDLVVNNSVLLELKSVSHLEPIHEAQVLTYLRLSRLPIALLINFNVPLLRHGLKRFALTQSLPNSAPSTPPR
ncbi:GxxExxY protein [Nibricoccus aquaticus]|uniref:GxxExxY protein n=1 Tax=Nibricoccus aquaticus TaxID=2576891 RepID=A0A290Q6D1_9BACT|nr:GxxExxY protein [Nibricoccus aquaticus]ATC62740.1 GxxExxY protein [Nibricoccus aquaticus]